MAGCSYEHETGELCHLHADSPDHVSRGHNPGNCHSADYSDGPSELALVAVYGAGCCIVVEGLVAVAAGGVVAVVVAAAAGVAAAAVADGDVAAGVMMHAEMSSSPETVHRHHQHQKMIYS